MTWRLEVRTTKAWLAETTIEISPSSSLTFKFDEPPENRLWAVVHTDSTPPSVRVARRSDAGLKQDNMTFSWVTSSGNNCCPVVASTTSGPENSLSTCARNSSALSGLKLQIG